MTSRDARLAWLSGGLAVLLTAALAAGLALRDGAGGAEVTPGPGDPSAPGVRAPATSEPSSTPAREIAGPRTTGVRDGRALATREAGDIAEDGLHLDGVHITGDVTVRGSGVTLSDTRIDGHLAIRGGADVTVRDSEVGALTISSAQRVTISRVEVFGASGQDGIHVTSDRGRAADVVIEDSWVHSPQVEAESHYDGIQVRGVDRLTLRGNTFDLGPWRPQFNAAVFLEEANGGNDEVLVEGNYINGGGFSVYVFGTGVRLVDNVFGEDENWGLLYPESVPFAESGSTRLDGGEPAVLR